jgi:HK97 family phage prohead protease
VKTATLNRTVKLRSEVKGNTLYGHAAVFDQETFIPGEGWEVMTRSAFDEVLDREDTDVRALFNHDMSMLLGRQSSGTLRLSVDSEGLPFEVDLPDTQLGRDVRVLLERGDLDGASFAWMPGESELRTRQAGGQVRAHTRVSRLVDVSVVTLPAYAGAGAALRSEQLGYTFENDPRSRLIRARARIL